MSMNITVIFSNLQHARGLSGNALKAPETCTESEEREFPRVCVHLSHQTESMLSVMTQYANFKVPRVAVCLCVCVYSFSMARCSHTLIAKLHCVFSQMSHHTASPRQVTACSETGI